ncbi:MAG: PEP-CTERM system TPR-repeat protein PrsT [Gammaproteobacteria bacterium]|nr:PEP-CTERM system TPR-repeat protein PrsT [Gammaproteobacteria bacterium]
MNKRTKRMARGAAILSACCLLAACGADVSTEDLISRAEQHLARGDYASATIELKNAVASDINNAQARLLLGKTYFESSELESAEKELGRARELGAPRAEVLPLLAQARVALGMHDQLMELNAEGLPVAAQAEVLAAQGLSLLGKRELDEAGKRLETALTLSPQSPYVRVAQARLLLANSQVDGARKQLDQALASDPAYAPAWSLLGDIEQQQQQPERAEDAYGKALDADPDNFGDRLKRALLRIQAQKAELAAQDVAELRKAAPKHPGVFFAEGLLHLQKNELDAAKTAFEETVKGGDTFPFALFYLAAINAQQGNQTQAEVYAERFLAIAPDNAPGRNLAASLALRAGDHARAERFVRPVAAANPEDVAALNLLASALLGQGKTDEGLDLLAKVAEVQPESALAQTRLAAGLLATGQGAVGEEHLRKALELDPGFHQADVLLVLNELRQKDIAGALEAAEDFRDRNPDAATPYNVLGRVYLAANDVPKARSAFLKALEIAPGDPGASQSLAALALRDKDYEAARGYYDGVLAQHPDYMPVHMQLAALELAQGREDAMADRLAQLVKTYPLAVEPRLTLSRYKLARAQVPDALGLLEELGEEQKKQPVVLAQIAAIQLAQGDHASAKASLDRLVQLQPGSASARYQLAMAWSGLNDNARARQELERAIELDSNYVPARIALARLFLAQDDRQEFEIQLVALRQLQPQNPDVLLLEAALARLQGKDDEVLERLERAYAVAPAPATVQGLAVERANRGDRDAGVKLLRDWVESTRTTRQRAWCLPTCTAGLTRSKLR